MIMNRISKITLIIGVLVTVIVAGFLFLKKKHANVAKTRVHAPTPAIINCTQACRRSLKAALNYDRIHNQVQGSQNMGEQMSISLPNASKGLQPIMKGNE